MDLIDEEMDIIFDSVEGESPCCGGDVCLGHCSICGEPCDPITEVEEN